jgi:signal recognition particle subunit SRP54
MTPNERANPKVIDVSRRRRIARGAGCDPSDVSQLVKQFEPMRNMMKAMSGQSFMQRIRMSTQFSKMMAGGGIPKLKGSTTANRRVLSKKDRRKKRRRR